MTHQLSPEDERLVAWLRVRSTRELGPDEATLDRVGRTVTEEFAAAVGAGGAAGGAAGATRAAAAGASGGRGSSRWDAWRSARTSGRTDGRRFGTRAFRGLAGVALAGAIAVPAVAGPAFVLASESAPGHALYDIRLAVEDLTMPPRGSAERLAADLRRLDARVTEAKTAVEHREWHAADAALAAARAETADLDAELAGLKGDRAAARAEAHRLGEVLVQLADTDDLPADVRGSSASLAHELHVLVRAGTHPLEHGGLRSRHANPRRRVDAPLPLD